MTAKLRFLNIEDNPLDAEIIEDELRKEWPDCDYSLISTEIELSDALAAGKFDAILGDYSLPGFDGMSALSFVRRHSPETPFLFVTGSMGEEMAIESLKNGATDYILKIHLSKLIPAINRALRDSLAEAERKQYEWQFKRNYERLELMQEVNQFPASSVQELLDFALDKILALTDSSIGYIYHYSEETRQFTLKTWSKDAMELCHVAAPQTIYQLEKTGIWGEVVRQRKAILINGYEAPDLLRKGYPEEHVEGHVNLSRFLCIPIFDNDRIIAVVGVANKSAPYDQTDLLQLTLMMEGVWKIASKLELEERLINAGHDWQSTFDAISDSIVLIDSEQRIIRCNQATSNILGRDFADFIKQPCWKLFHGTDAPISDCPCMKSKLSLHSETVTIQQNEKFFEMTIDPILSENGVLSGAVHIVRDVTENKRAAEEKLALEQQFQQAQKMESVGRLAGGVAHDFNNMLGVIIGHAELALMKLEPSQPLYSSITEIQKAAERSADLTRQLLAFARKQTIAPKAIDLNDVVSGMLKMLQRLIGEDMHLVWKPAPGLWPVKVDPSQIDQILANLCVNARDAITDVGKITIETGNATIDESYSRPHKYVEPGEYVQLIVSDNGRGMGRETVAQIFEPFFTTKAAGQGTGLGLSTVYGIIKQNNGFINVYSEPGHGTTFSIYLPRHTGESVEAPKKSAAESISRGSETILLVEDEPSILEATVMLLEKLGYKVLKAGGAREAAQLSEKHAGAIQMLMTDVVMPDMNGRDLTRELQSLNPQLKCLFMSGYTANVIAHHGVLDDGVYFIQKPFSLHDLATKVREVLDSE